MSVLTSVARPLPVLHRERVQRQHADAEPRGRLDRRRAPNRCRRGGPSTRGRWRCAAQRPLPSMMIATCAGSRSKSTCRASASSDDPGGTTPGAAQATSRHYKSSYSDRRRGTAPRRAPSDPPAPDRATPGHRARVRPATGRARSRPACPRWPAPCAGEIRRRSPRRRRAIRLATDRDGSNRALGRARSRLLRSETPRNRACPRESTPQPPSRRISRGPDRCQAYRRSNGLQHRRVPDAIAIRLLARVEAGMEVGPALDRRDVRARRREDGAFSARTRASGDIARSSVHEAT